MTFEIRSAVGDEAEIDTAEGALLAAYTLQQDHVEGTNLIPPTITIHHDRRHALTITRRIRHDDLKGASS